MIKPTYLLAGNWKMNGTPELIIGVREALAAQSTGAEIAIFPPCVYLSEAALHLRGTAITWGAQDVSEHESGAYTGEVSALMLKNVGCRYVLVGHSERRMFHHETNAIVARKFAAAKHKGLIPILCVGETVEQRKAGLTHTVLFDSLQAVIDLLGPSAFDNAVIAYEPVWAIGSGQAATPEQAQEVHFVLRKWVEKCAEPLAKSLQILYGGSVSAVNAEALLSMPDINGALVGGASLNPTVFAQIASFIAP